MFISSHNAVYDKRGRRSSVRKSSQMSLLSGITISSDGSSGSSSTVTQESVSRPRSRTPKSSHGTARSKKQKAQMPMSEGRYISHEFPRPSRPKLDVFAFLDTDQSRTGLVQFSDGASHRQNDHAKIPLLHHDDSDVESSTLSHNSDSGISMGDHSPAPIERCGAARPVLGPLVEEKNISTPSKLFPFERMLWSSTEGEGEDCHRPNGHDAEYNDSHPRAFYAYDASDSRDEHPRRSAGVYSTSTTPSIPDLSGYDLLASRLDQPNANKPTLPPLYRRFSKLNHRILLQLQDEIAEMEGDLASIDGMDARYRVDATGQPMQASRRLDWQWRGSELHARRLDLLGRIYIKVEQYNQALASYQRVLNTTSPALTSDISEYRKWMEDNAPIVEEEAKFLEAADLLTFRPHASNSFLDLVPSTSATRVAVITGASTVLLPLLILALVPWILPRLVLLVIGYGALLLLCPHEIVTELLASQDTTVALYVYLALICIGVALV